MVGSRRNLLKLRNNAFRYFAIEGVARGGSQEKRDGSQECKILVGNWRRQVWIPLFHLHIWLFVKARRETPDFIGSKVGRLSVNFAFLILLDTYLRPFHSWKRVKGIRVYCILLLVNSEEGVGQ